MGMGISWKWELMTQLGMGMGRNGVTVGQLAAMDFFRLVNVTVDLPLG